MEENFIANNFLNQKILKIIKLKSHKNKLLKMFCLESVVEKLLDDNNSWNEIRFRIGIGSNLSCGHPSLIHFKNLKKKFIN